jgi:16S rRNA G966 N2-methylase RsmD
MLKISEEELRDLYEKQLLSDREIGEKIGAFKHTIRKWRNVYGIEPISHQERKRKLKGGFTPIEDRQMQIILGSLLGDATLKGSSKNSRHFAISHSIKQKDYLEVIYNDLKSLCPSGLSEYIDKKRGYVTYTIQTEARKEFKDIYDKIYLPKKQMNEWILSQLTDLSLAIWYLDDGSYNYVNQSKSEFSFATNCFSEGDNYLAQRILKENFDLDFEVRHFKKRSGVQCNLVVNKSSEKDFIEIISPHIPKSMLYKIPSQERFDFLLKNIQIPVSKEQLNKWYWEDNFTQDKIAKLLNTSRQSVQKYMYLYQIPKRTKKEAQKNRESKTDKLGRFKKTELTDDLEKRAQFLLRQLKGSGFPYYEIGQPSDYCNLFERLVKLELERNDSGEYSYSSSCMKVIRDFCPQLFQMKRKGSLSPVEIFSDDKMLLDCIRRTIKYARKDSIASVRSGLKTYKNNKAVSNFPPIWAKTIIKDLKLDNAKMLDYSSGFGGRIVGAYCSGQIKKYVGVDPCERNYKSVQKIGKVIDYHVDLSKSDFQWELNNSTAEDYFQTCKEKFDLVLTSPPYFDLEIYENKSDQSYVRYEKYSDWLNNWHHEILDSSKEALNDDGYCCIFISNNKENNLLDDTKSYMEKIFGNCNVQGFLLPNVEYNRNKNIKRLDYCLMSKK